MHERVCWVSSALVPALFGLATIALQRAGGIVMFDDELGFLGEAVLLSAREGEALLAGVPFYSAGYPLLLALPLSLVPTDPWTVAVGTNVVLLAATGPVLYALVRRLLDLPPPAAAAAAIAGATVPSVVFQVPRAWSELAVTLAFAVWALLVVRWSRLGPGTGAVPVAIAAGVLLAVHRRATAVVALTLVAIAVWGVGRTILARRAAAADVPPVPWRQLVLAEAAGAATVVAALRLDAHVVDRLYDGRTSGSRLDKAENLLSTDWIPALLGHVWAMLATSFGLVAVGGLWLVWAAWRRREPVAGTVLVLAVGGVVATSVLFHANGVRADQLVYERYTAPVLPVVVAIGVGAIAASLRQVRWWLLAAGAAVAGCGAVLSVSLQDSRLTGDVQKLTVPGLTSLNMVDVGWGEPFVPRIHVWSITAVAVVAVVALLATLRWPALGVGAVLAAWAGVVAVGSAGNLRPFLDVWEPTGREAASFLDGAGAEVLQVAPGVRNESRNVVHYRLDYPDAVLADPPRCDVSPYVLAPVAADLAGARPLVAVEHLPDAVHELPC